jgi:hypothetical protein
MTDKTEVDQNSAVREELAKEVWEGAEPSTPTKEAEPAKPEVKEADPWEGVPTTVRSELEGLRAKVGGMETLDYRLKQTESRLGGVLNELHAAKEAAKAVANAPSKEQIAQAAQSQSDWDSLKDDFPEWTKATEGKLAAERAEILKQFPDIKALREEIKAETNNDLNTARMELAESMVSLKHPDWSAVKETPEFKQWHAGQNYRDSFNPIEVIKIFDEFATFKANTKSPKEIAAERRERLETSQTTQGRRLPPAKSEADMTEAEIRAATAKEVWG